MALAQAYGPDGRVKELKTDASGALIVSGIAAAPGGGGGTTAAAVNPLLFNLSITTGGTAIAARPAMPDRTILAIQNNSTGVLWINVWTTAAANTGLQIQANDYYEFPAAPDGAVSVWGATAGQNFAILEG